MRAKTAAATAFSTVLLACCATVPQPPIAPAPTCHDNAQCAAEWAEARTFVLNNAAMKIQTYSDDFLQTYNSPSYSTDLAAQVNKAPLPGGGYEIDASFSCDNIFACVPNSRTTLDHFNRDVAAAGAQVRVSH